MQIKKTTDQNNQHKLNMLVYGHGGVGKTTFAAQAPNPVIADCESGTKYLGQQGIEAYVATIETWKDVEAFYAQVKDSDYETVIVDPIGEVMEKLLRELKADAQFSNKVGGLTMAGWGVAKDRVRGFIKSLRDLDKHVILVGHVEEKQDDEQRLVKRPQLQTKLAQEVINMMDVVAYMQQAKDDEGNVKRVLRVDPESDAIEAKDRSGKLETLVKPDFSEIISTIMQSTRFVKDKEQDKKEAEFEKELDNAAPTTEEVTESLKESFGGEETTARKQMKQAMNK